MNIQLYRNNNLACSKITTTNYSTSFSKGIRAFHKSLRTPIYAIYGFVRYADEIVDTFFDHPQKELFEEFKQDTYKAIKRKISSNPIIDSFQWVVNEYNIEQYMIDAFLNSMETDLYRKYHNLKSIDEYIFGSAEVVGLMCLKVFTGKNNSKYEALKEEAKNLGRAFQKVNFLRDIGNDFEERGRLYFPEIDFYNITEKDKESIIKDIDVNFCNALQGIKLLDKKSKRGVFLAYTYYLKLLQKIKYAPVQTIMKQRYRISNFYKAWLFLKAMFIRI